MVDHVAVETMRDHVAVETWGLRTVETWGTTWQLKLWGPRGS